MQRKYGNMHTDANVSVLVRSDLIEKLHQDLT
jgi:hypothetical protein